MPRFSIRYVQAILHNVNVFTLLKSGLINCRSTCAEQIIQSVRDMRRKPGPMRGGQADFLAIPTRSLPKRQIIEDFSIYTFIYLN